MIWRGLNPKRERWLEDWPGLQDSEQETGFVTMTPPEAKSRRWASPEPNGTESSQARISKKQAGSV
jgi:hypothetical protein